MDCNELRMIFEPLYSSLIWYLGAYTYIAYALSSAKVLQEYEILLASISSVIYTFLQLKNYIYEKEKRSSESQINQKERFNSYKLVLDKLHSIFDTIYTFIMLYTIYKNVTNNPKISYLKYKFQVFPIGVFFSACIIIFESKKREYFSFLNMAALILSAYLLLITWIYLVMFSYLFTNYYYFLNWLVLNGFFVVCTNRVYNWQNSKLTITNTIFEWTLLCIMIASLFTTVNNYLKVWNLL